MPQPPSAAFPEAGLHFLKGLRRNNRREWFLERKAVYETCVQAPMQAIVEAMAVEFARFAPDQVATRKVSLFRIYRDTRFSKDKSPYKTQIAAVFPRRGLPKHEGAGFYFHIAPDELFIGGGLYMPLTEDLHAVRSAIASGYRRFSAIVTAPRFRRMFGEVTGEKLNRTPRGFPADHQAAGFLRFKQFLAVRVLPAEVSTEPRFHKTLVETFETLYPLVQFLNEPILRSRKAKSLRNVFVED